MFKITRGLILLFIGTIISLVCANDLVFDNKYSVQNGIEDDMDIESMLENAGNWDDDSLLPHYRKLDDPCEEEAEYESDICFCKNFNEDQCLNKGRCEWVTGECIPTSSEYESLTEKPTFSPTADPTLEPTADPTLEPTASPTEFDCTLFETRSQCRNHDDECVWIGTKNDGSCFKITETPTEAPNVVTDAPTFSPTADPTNQPTADPTADPTNQPTFSPTLEPTASPTEFDCTAITSRTKCKNHDDECVWIGTKNDGSCFKITEAPTEAPNVVTDAPTFSPTADPTNQPTADPTADPTNQPTFTPTLEPTASPTEFDCNTITNQKVCRNVDECIWIGTKKGGSCFTITDTPTEAPVPPTNEPTDAPTFSPTNQPTFSPTFSPTIEPTASPTEFDCTVITNRNTCNKEDECVWFGAKKTGSCFTITEAPTEAPVPPTNQPTFSPTFSPTSEPTASPTEFDCNTITNQKLCKNEDVCIWIGSKKKEQRIYQNICPNLSTKKNQKLNHQTTLHKPKS
jgi:hypothetical protein